MRDYLREAGLPRRRRRRGAWLPAAGGACERRGGALSRRWRWCHLGEGGIRKCGRRGRQWSLERRPGAPARRPWGSSSSRAGAAAGGGGWGGGAGGQSQDGGRGLGPGPCLSGELKLLQFLLPRGHERFRIASTCLDQPRCEFPLAEARGSGTGATPGPHLSPQGSVPGDPVRIDCNITES